jgi:membrane protein DedA with SNARE-associated domain
VAFWEVTVQHLADALLGVYGTWGYLLVLAGALVENTTPLGLMLPAGTLVMVGGVYVQQGVLSLLLALAAGWLGALSGLQCNFMLGRWLLPRYLSDTKLMAWIRPRLPKAERFLQHHGQWAYVLAEFSGPMRSLVTVASGMSTMSYRRYLLYSLLPALAFSLGNLGVGYLAGAGIGLLQDRSRERDAAVPLVVAALAIYVAHHTLYLRRTSKRLLG